MKLFKKINHGYAGFATLVISLLVIFGTLAGTGDIYGFFADTGFSDVSLAAFGMKSSQIKRIQRVWSVSFFF